MHFWAGWCEPCAFLDTVLAQLAADRPGVRVLRVEAEEAANISEAYSVSMVPYFLFFADGRQVDALEGADAAALSAKFAALASGGAAAAPAAAAGAPAAAAAAVPPQQQGEAAANGEQRGSVTKGEHVFGLGHSGHLILAVRVLG